MNNSSSSRLEFLDVARGLAALFVVIEHGFHSSVDGYLAWSRSHVIAGQGAIVAFFLISGFVIPLSLESCRSAAAFWVRRIFRLFPVYWASLALAFAYLWLGGPLGLGVDRTDIVTWVLNMFLVEHYFHRPDVWGVSWTLHFEMAFYVACSAMFAVGLLRRFGPAMYSAILAGFAMLVVIKLLRTRNPTDDLYTWSLYMAFLVGMLANRYVAGQVGRRQFYALLACALGVLLATWTFNNRLYPAIATPWQLVRCTMLNAIGYGLFFTLLEMRHRRMPAWGTWLGLRSYPIYLLHPLALILIQAAGGATTWPLSVTMATLVAASLALADVVHRFVEQPGIALGRAIERRIWPRPETKPVAFAPRAAA